jgi:hypothetical protein
VLAYKIRMFELVIGELDLILGQLDDQRGFEQRLESAWAESQSEEELLAMLAELEDVLGGAIDTYQTIRPNPMICLTCWKPSTRCNRHEPARYARLCRRLFHPLWGHPAG